MTTAPSTERSQASKHVQFPRFVLAFDSDEPGVNAAIKAEALIRSILDNWGHPSDPSNDDDQLIARYQNLWCDAFNTWHENGAEEDDETAETMTHLFEYIVYLKEHRRENLYPEAQTAEEYCAASEAEAMMHKMEPKKKLDFAAIKERVDIVDYIGQRVKLRKVGGKFAAKCPLPGHEDKSASFYVFPETKSFWCFGCQRGGDVIDFAKTYDGTMATEL